MAERPEFEDNPGAVLDALLAACRRSRSEAAQLLWQLGAEKLRRMAGDEVNLERLLGNELFSPLIAFERLELAPLEQVDGSARRSCTAFSADGQPARFLFSLKREVLADGRDRWQISGVEREW